jgi:hypothetical protein
MFDPSELTLSHISPGHGINSQYVLTNRILPDTVLAAEPIGHPLTGMSPPDYHYAGERRRAAPLPSARAPELEQAWDRIFREEPRYPDISLDSDDSDRSNPVPRRRGYGAIPTARARQVEIQETPRAHSISPRTAERIRAIHSKERPKPATIAKARPITARLDEQDRIMMDLKKQGFKDEEVRDKLVQLGFPEYAARTISSRQKRVIEICAKEQDELLDRGLIQWTSDDDSRLSKAYADADAELEKSFGKLENSRWTLVARKINKTPGPCFSTRACRNRHCGLNEMEIDDEKEILPEHVEDDADDENDDEAEG